MDAEIIFFMTEVDQKNFLLEVEKHCDHIEKEADLFQFLVGNCTLQFTQSAFEDNTLFCGKLEIRSVYSGAAFTDHEKAKAVFRKLRNWLKKSYWSRLAYNNKNKKDKLTPSRNHWLGPDAKLWNEANPKENLLKLSKTSWMTFNIGY